MFVTHEKYCIFFEMAKPKRQNYSLTSQKNLAGLTPGSIVLVLQTKQVVISNSILDCYRAFQRFGQAKMANGGLFLGSS